MSENNPAVDAWVAKAKAWHDEIATLRAILLDSGMTEDFKWGKPCYAHAGSNVVLIMPLKDTCALLFTKGALVKDPKGLLVQPGENSQSARQMRFTSLSEITRLEKPLKAILEEALAVEVAGLKVAFKKSADLVYPKEFQDKLDKNSALREAFRALTPGRQRQYHMHFTGAKLAATRESRVDKAIPLILDGMGLDD
ncbi:MAG: YdeI/OmpD-associated family protein [Caulobacter sp.]|nr:YdeI/OmpD-associated family protein [Vitreoscilla sp.]